MARVSKREGYHVSRHGRWRPNERQRLVLDALVEGKTNFEIAELLGITLDGAKWHVGEMLSLTGLTDRQALAQWWRQGRNRKQSLFAGVAGVKWTLVAGGIVLIAVASLVALRRDTDGTPTSSRLEPPSALGFDLPATPAWTPTATPPIPDAYFACPVTRPNGKTPPGESPGPTFYGNSALWTAVGGDGRFVFRAADLPPDRSLSLKWVWWTTMRSNDFATEAKRLDGPGSFSGDFTPGFSGAGTPVWVGGPSFSDPGCWRVTAQLGDESLTVVVFLQILH
jgi:DNA-binding CsgD family transcriptional regulator